MGLRSKIKCLMTLEIAKRVSRGTVNLGTRFQQWFWNVGLGFRLGNFFLRGARISSNREVGAWSSRAYLDRH